MQASETSWQSRHPYFGQKIVLTSKHEKLRLIKPAFEGVLGCELFEENLDTDQLGTFSGEIERSAPPRQTAIKKARLGMAANGMKIGLASEGSVGPDPSLPFVRSNIEHLVLVDDSNEIVISEIYRSFEICAATIKVRPDEDLVDFLKRADFPNHGLIVRPDSEEKFNCVKGITDLVNLQRAIRESAKKSTSGLVVVESDLRAMHSPSRQQNIQQVAALLALKVSQLCPQCRLPGWGRVGYECGLMCSECDLEDPNAIRQERLGCVKCDYRQLGKVIAEALNPAQCNFCNP